MKDVISVAVQKDTLRFYWVKDILEGLQEAANKSDYTLDVTEDYRDVCGMGDHCKKAVIIIGYTTEWLYETLEYFSKKGIIPIVVNSCITESMKKICNAVSFKLNETLETAIEYLFGAGRKHIALLGTNPNSLADELKEQTFKKYLGLSDEKNIFRGSPSLSECVDNFIDYFVDSNINAVICSNDTVAIYLINRLLDDGFNIPPNLYIVGMGNSKLGQEITIPLTTVDLDYRKLGNRALEMWKISYNSSSKERSNITIPCELIVRSSTENFTFCNDNIFSSNMTQENNLKTETDQDEFYDDQNIRKIFKLEDFLIACDDIDYSIIKEILKGVSDTKMVDHLNISDRAIRYRIKKMFKRLGVQSRVEMVNCIKELRVFGSNNND